MTYKLKAFQETAVSTLLDKFFFSKKDTIIFSSPTGSGKTIMMIELIKRIIINNPRDYNYAFVWLTPGNGELEEQSYKSALRESNSIFVPQLLMDVLSGGFKESSVTFINWEQVKGSKNNLAMKDGEVANLPDRIDEAHQAGVRFILIVDEEHRDNTVKAKEVIERFKSEKNVRVSATPQSNGDAYDNIQVNIEDVVAEGMITRAVELNSGVNDGDTYADDVEYFIDLADSKRREIKAAYEEIGKNINPLVLIQFPDEKKSNKEYMDERGRLVEKVNSYLLDIGQHPKNISRWLSNEKINTSAIEVNDSEVNYLLMKQAVSTGWDAPRAKILVKLRLNTNPTFTLQTIGRIRRMPEQKHYNKEILDNAFIYSNDDKYVNDIITAGEGFYMATYSLREDAPNFYLKSLKPNEYAKVLPNTKAKEYRDFLVKKYKLSTDGAVLKNKETLKKHDFDFSNLMKINLGKSDDLDRDIISEKIASYQVKVPIDTQKHRLNLLNAEQKTLGYFHLSTPPELHAIFVELFSNRGDDLFKYPLLNLKNVELMAFIINNADRIRHDAQEMDSGTINLFDEDKFNIVDFVLPEKEVYKVYKDTESKKLLTKNIYEGYSTANWVNQSKPEKMFEEWLENSPKVKYWYRSRDRGEQYFSIPYGDKAEGFFPDYLVQDNSGITYIIETKGGENQNIDKYSGVKFNALRQYVESDWGSAIEFAFVRPLGASLVYNNSIWKGEDGDIRNQEIWRPIPELFERENSLF